MYAISEPSSLLLIVTTAFVNAKCDGNPRCPDSLLSFRGEFQWLRWTLTAPPLKTTI